jgi:hypothetical protein
MPIPGLDPGIVADVHGFLARLRGKTRIARASEKDAGYTHLLAHAALNVQI